MTFYLYIPVQHKSLTMPASFRGREGGVDWDKKSLLANVFQFVTELQLETPQDSDESTLYMNEWVK